MNGGDIQARDARRNNWVATTRTCSRNIHNQSLSLQSKSAILLFVTTCLTFRNGLAQSEKECPARIQFGLSQSSFANG